MHWSNGGRLLAGGATLALSMTLGLTACSVPQNGITGVTVDSEGRLMAMVAWCTENPPDLLILRRLDREDVLARYYAPRLTGLSASVRLEAPGGGWTVTPGAPNFEPLIEYRMYGATEDNSNSTRSVTFRVQDAENLKPGLMLIEKLKPGPDGAVETLVVVSRTEFRRHTSQVCESS